jgi:hypothetical protein
MNSRVFSDTCILVTIEHKERYGRKTADDGWQIRVRYFSCIQKHRKFRIDSDFATTSKSYIYPWPILACSDMWVLIFIINQNNLIKKSCQGKELKKPMTDNLKVKASKAVDDARVAAHAAYDDAKVATHNSIKDARVEAQKVSDDVKIGVHKAVSDAKIAAHEAGSKLKKR